MEREAKPEGINAPEQNQDQTARFKSLLTARFERSMAVSESFFKTESSRVAQVCREMAQRFHRGGRLLAFGAGAAASDAQHVAVEFVHPVTVGRRALPGLALGEETSLIPLNAGQNGAGSAFAHRLRVLARTQDIAVGVSTGPLGDRALVEALDEAHQRGLLTLVFTGGKSDLAVRASVDFCFVVDDPDPWIIQETHRTLYHILWELVHVYLEHERLLQA